MHQSVYDKALAIFQEGAKSLERRTKAIDRERIQSTIEHKLQEREIKRDLLTMIKEKNRLENEPKLEKPSVLRREHTFSGLESLKKRKTLQTQRSVDCFPSITCTTANVPKIMRRKLSSESEFHNWVTGLPKVGKRSLIALQLVTKDNDAKPSTTDSPPPPKTANTRPSTNTAPQRKTSNSEGPIDDTVDHRRFSRVSNIVYNVPLFSREDRKLVKSHSFPSNKHKVNLPKINPLMKGKKALKRAETQQQFHSNDKT